MQTVEEGIDFLGFVVKPDYTLTRLRVVKNLKERLWNFNKDSEKMTEEKIGKMLSVVNSYYGQLRHSNTFGLRQKLWRHNFGRLRNFLSPIDKNMSYFNLVKSIPTNLET